MMNSPKENHSSNMLDDSISRRSNNNNNNVAIRMDNVHQFSTYELRQELEKHGVCPFQNDNDSKNKSIPHGERNINHNVLMQKMIQILYKEEETKKDDIENEHDGIHGSIEKCSIHSETVKERLHREKMERKKEAMERSKRRQQDKEYFLQKKIANEEYANRHKDKEYKVNMDNDPSLNTTCCSNSDDNENVMDQLDSFPSNEESSNPFAIRFRSKIGGKCM